MLSPPGEKVIKKKKNKGTVLNAERYLLKEHEHKRIKANYYHFDASQAEKS